MKIAILMSVLVLTALFQNCSEISSTDEISQESASNTVKGCGMEGFKFITKHYFTPKCSACHSEDGFAYPLFTIADTDQAFFNLKSYTETLVGKSTHNPFCGPDCELTEEDDMLRLVKEWAANPSVCPE